MKKIGLLILLFALLFSTCDNPFWPDINFGDKEEEITDLHTVIYQLEKTVVDINIKSQPNKLIYEHGETLNLAGLEVTLEFDDYTQQDFPYDSPYISANMAHGSTLYTAHNGQPVEVSYLTFSKTTENLTVNPARIMSAEIDVTVPVTGVNPNTNANASGSGNFSVGTVTWSPNETPFRANAAYTVSVTLLANTNYTFTNGLTTRTINGQTADIANNDGSTAVLTYTFPATGNKIVNNITIKQQPSNLTFNHGAPLDLAGLEVTLHYNDSSTADFALGVFGINNITTSPANGTILSRSQNNTPVTVSFNGLNLASNTTNNLIINPAPITNAALTVTAPATGAPPANASGTGNFSITSTSWDPGTTPFRGNTQYTVTVILAANENYTFTNGLTTRTVNGQPATVTSNTGSSATITYQFNATDEKTVSSIALKTNPGLTYNHGQALDLSALVIERIYNDTTRDDYAFGSFGPYITAVPGNGTTLSIPEHGSKPVIITYTGLTPINTGNLVINPAPIINADVTVTTPATGTTPITTATGTGNFSVSEVTWSTGGNPFTGPFLANTVYTASVTLTANNYFTFTGGLTTPSSATINGENAAITNRSASSVTLSYQFTTSSQVITGITIKNHPTNLTYTHGQPLSLNGLEVTLTFNNNPSLTEDVPYTNFTLKGLSTSPSTGTILLRSHNGTRVRVSAGENFADTNPIVVNLAPVNSAALTVTAPVIGVTPNATAAGTGNFTIGAVTWNPNETPFRGSTAYTVSVTLTAAENYTFTGGLTTASSATINGQNAVVSAINGNTVILSFTFNATPAKTVSSIALKTNPRLTYNHGETLDLSALVIERIYNDTTRDDLAFGSFGANVTTAPVNGTTLSIPTHNGNPVVVTYTGLPPVNTGNLVISPAPITAVALSVPQPVTAGIPGSASGTGNFSITSTTWSPNHNPFRGGTPYTVTVTLTANANYTFTGGLSTATIDGAAATVSNNTGSAVTLSRQFTATAAATITNMVIKTQPTLSYTHGETLNLSALEVTLTYNDGTSVDIPFSSFGANGLTTSLANNTVLSRSVHNTQTITVTHNTFGNRNTNALSVIRASGTTVQTLTVTPGTNATSVIITAAALAGPHEQTAIEYAVNTTGAEPAASDWNDLGSRPFTISGLTQGTDYYVFARAKESPNFNAGASISRTVRTLTNLTNITITFNPNADIALTAAAGTIEISRSANTQQTFTLTGASYTSIQWFINGSPVTGAASSSFTLRGQDFNQFTPVQSQLYVEVVRNGVTYNLTIPFRVNP